MTEEEWAASTDPEAMLEVARESLRSDWPHDQRTKRKRVLFGLACCRLIWPLIAGHDLCLRAVEFMDSEVDGRSVLSESEKEDLLTDLQDDFKIPPDSTPEEFAAAEAVAEASNPDLLVGDLLISLANWGDAKDRARQVADILRDVVGNPFRPVTADPAWLTPTVTALARQMYDGRDFTALPLLADALQDAGCDHADVLEHCRGPGPHVRGCWVLDLVLGKQ